MLPWDACPADRLAQLKGVMTDIDDTVTTAGRLTAQAYRAMEDLQRAGLILIPITGRPAGWCDHIARMWPVDAVVGENGAFWFRYDARKQQMERHFVADEAVRRSRREDLRLVAERILREVPRARVASDQLYRDTDLAIDFAEDVERLSDAAIEKIVSIMKEHGLTAKVSSIHVNGWHGNHDKLTTSLALLEAHFGISRPAARDRFAFIGDSPNDQPMFEYFSCSVGVANVRDFATQLAVLPQYVTRSGHGAGFAEFAARVIQARSV